MKENNKKGLNDRDLEILNILGFDDEKENPLPVFLEKNLKTADISNLHDQGVSLRSVKMILKKLNPYHKIFIIKHNDNFYDDRHNLSSAESVDCCLSSNFSVSTKQEIPMPNHYW